MSSVICQREDRSRLKETYKTVLILNNLLVVVER